MGRIDRLLNFFIYSGQTFVTTLLPLVALLVLTRYLTPHDFGALALVQVYSICVVGLASLGLPVTIKRNYFEFDSDTSKLSQLLFSVMVFSGIMLVLVFFLTWLWMDSVFSILNVESNTALLFCALASQSLNILSQYYLSYFVNSEDAASYSKYMILASLMNSSMSVVFVVIGLGVLGIPLAGSVTWMFVFCLLSVVYLRRLGFSFSNGILLYTLKISVPLAPKEVLKTMSTQVDKYMLGVLGGVEVVGIYNIAQRIAVVVSVYMSVLQNLFSPLVYRMMFEESVDVEQRIAKALTPYLFLSVVVPLLIILFGADLVGLMFPNEYAGVADIVAILSLYYGVLFIGMVTSKQLLYKKKSFFLTLLVLFSFSLNVALNYPLILAFGAPGAAWATLLTGVMTTVLSVFLAQRYLRINWEFKMLLALYSLLLGACLAAQYYASHDFWNGMKHLVSLLFLVLFALLVMKYQVIDKAKLNYALRSTLNRFWKVLGV